MPTELSTAKESSLAGMNTLIVYDLSRGLRRFQNEVVLSEIAPRELYERICS